MSKCKGLLIEAQAVFLVDKLCARTSLWSRSMFQALLVWTLTVVDWSVLHWINTARHSQSHILLKSYYARQAIMPSHESSLALVVHMTQEPSSTSTFCMCAYVSPPTWGLNASEGPRGYVCSPRSSMRHNHIWSTIRTLPGNVQLLQWCCCANLTWNGTVQIIGVEDPVEQETMGKPSHR